MWDALYDVCARERVTIHTLCTRISERKDANTSLTAAIRVFALAYFRAAATEDGHMSGIAWARQSVHPDPVRQ